MTPLFRFVNGWVWLTPFPECSVVIARLLCDGVKRKGEKKEGGSRNGTFLEFHDDSVVF